MALGRGRAKDNTTAETAQTTDTPTVADPTTQQVEPRQTVKRAIEEIVPEIMGGSDFSEEALRDAETFEDFLALAEAEYGTIEYADAVLGDGFTVLTREQKDMLKGVPCLFMSWAFRPGDFATPFVSVRVIARMPGTTSPAKFIINDSGAGIADQLARYSKRTGKLGSLYVKKGLTVSEYDKDILDDKGNTITIAAKTHYIDTSASL